MYTKEAIGTVGAPQEVIDIARETVLTSNSLWWNQSHKSPKKVRDIPSLQPLSSREVPVRPQGRADASVSTGIGLNARPGDLFEKALLD